MIFCGARLGVVRFFEVGAGVVLRTLVYLLVAFGLGACDGGASRGEPSPPTNTPHPSTSPSPTPLPAPDVTVTITGTLSFDWVPHNTVGGLDYGETQRRPIRGVTVQALDENEVLLSETRSNSEGQYALRVGEGLPVKIRVLAGLLRLGTPAWNFSVNDNTRGNALYVMEGSLVDSGSADSVRDLHAASGWDGSRYSGERSAAPFAILDAVYEGLQQVLAVAPDTQFSAAQLRWSVDNTPVSGNASAGLIGTSYYDPFEDTMYILGDDNNDTDEYDRSVIQHEWAHYLEDTLSRSDSIGGRHSVNASLDPRVAFSEGFANALAAIFSGQPLYRDSSGVAQALGYQFSLEHNVFSNNGWFSENSVGRLLYDIADDNADLGDDLALGVGPLLLSMTDSRYRDSEAFTSLYLFAEVFRQRYSEYEDGLEALLLREAVLGRSAYGEGETNDGAANQSFILPVYRQVSVGGTVEVCGNNAEGEYNGVDVRRYVVVDIPSAGTYVLRAQKSLGTGERDPDMIVHRRGQALRYFNSDAVNSERGTVMLDAGRHVVEIFDRLNTDQREGGGTACFNLTLSAGD